VPSVLFHVVESTYNPLTVTARVAGRVLFLRTRPHVSGRLQPFISCCLQNRGFMRRHESTRCGMVCSIIATYRAPATKISFLSATSANPAGHAHLSASRRCSSDREGISLRGGRSVLDTKSKFAIPTQIGCASEWPSHSPPGIG